MHQVTMVTLPTQKAPAPQRPPTLDHRREPRPRMGRGSSQSPSRLPPRARRPARPASNPRLFRAARRRAPLPFPRVRAVIPLPDRPRPVPVPAARDIPRATQSTAPAALLMNRATRPTLRVALVMVPAALATRRATRDMGRAVKVPAARLAPIRPASYPFPRVRAARLPLARPAPATTPVVLGLTRAGLVTAPAAPAMHRAAAAMVLPTRARPRHPARFPLRTRATVVPRRYPPRARPSQVEVGAAGSGGPAGVARPLEALARRV